MDETHDIVGADEEFQFHLLKLAGAERVIARGDFVAEGFADLRDAEGDFDPRGIEDVLELHENGLRRLGAEVANIILTLDGTVVGAEHQVEWTRSGQFAAAVRARCDQTRDGHLFGGEKFVELGGIRRTAALLDFLRKPGNGHIRIADQREIGGELLAFALAPLEKDRRLEAIGARFNQLRNGLRPILLRHHGPPLVGPYQLLAVFAGAHRVAEGVHVAAGRPNGRMHDDAGIQTDDIVAVARHGLPPCVAKVALQFRAHRTVIPETVEAAVDFGGLENETAPLAEADDLFHPLLSFFGHERQIVAVRARRVTPEVSVRPQSRGASVQGRVAGKVFRRACRAVRRW